MNVTTVKLADLTEDPENPRTHDRRNLDAIRRSLEEFGQVEPLVVRKGSGVVVGGNGRLAVMREMGWEEVKVVEVELDDARARALGIALNRTAELAGWDDEVLAQMLNAMQREEGSDHLITGFSDAEIEQLLIDTTMPGNPGWREEWNGMPEFVQDDMKSVRRIIVHFASEEAVRDFASLIEQKLTDRTRAIWYPRLEQIDHAAKQYVEVQGDAVDEA